MKKLFATLLSVVCAITMFAQVEIDGINYNLYESDGIFTAEVTGKDPGYEGDIVIPAVVEYENNAYSVTAIGGSAFYYCTSLSTVTIPEGVTSIGGSAFYYCTSLSSVTIPESVQVIGYEAYYGCSIKQVNISNLEAWCNISFVNIYSNPLGHAENLYLNGALVKDIVIPDGIIEIKNNTFFNCTSLNSITLPESVTVIGDNAFRNCYSLTEITIPESVTSIGGDAFNCVNAFFTLNKFYDIDYQFGDKAVFRVPADCVASYKKKWPDHATQIISQDIPWKYEVTVTARDNSSDVMDMVNCEAGVFDAMLNVVDLKVTGTINSYDIMTMRNKMLNLKFLDLSEADIVYNSYEYYTGCHTENNVLGESSFSGCSGLFEVKLSNSTTMIGYHAFANCYNLKEIIIPYSVTVIDNSAFYSCPKLKNVVFNPNLVNIGMYAFEQCNSLQSISLPPSLERIEHGAFWGCYGLTEVRIPEKISYIGDCAFNGDNNIRDIYTWTVEPTNIGQNTFPSSIFTTATLHVPSTAKKLYYWNTQWSQFVNMTEFNEPYTYFYLANQDLVIDKDTPRLRSTVDEENQTTTAPTADIYGNGGLIVEGDESQDLGDVNLSADNNGDSGTIIGGESSTETSGANVNINNLTITININAGRWYFFAFPFDIPFANIHFDGQVVWRYYDGDYRALHGSNAWKDHNGTDPILAHRGYIFQASKDGKLTLNIGPAAIGGADKMITLESHSAANAQDAGWNLIGNPFTSYYNLGDLGFQAPVTFWNGSSYEAMSPLDDNYTIHPFQAFFVQKPNSTEGVGFGAEFRETKNQSMDPDRRQNAQRRRMARNNSSTQRLLINMVITDAEGNTDKTRVVFNPEQTMGYDIESDASKFISADAIQLYSIDSENVKYAINERPEGDGTVKLGIQAPASGTYTITAPRMDCEMEIVDMKMGIVSSLAEEGYTFTAQKGADNDRFIIRKAGSTGIGSIEADDAAVEYIGVDGIVYGDKAPTGISIQKTANGYNKVINK